MLAAADGVISQLHMLHISKSVSWVLWIPVLSVSCCEAVTLVIKPCALIPDSVHMYCSMSTIDCVISSKTNGVYKRA